MKLALPNILIFDWDQGNLEHIKKHNVKFNECEDIFFDNPIYFEDEKHSDKEKRFLVYGVTNEERPLALVFTIRNNKIRIISARDQKSKERRAYNTNNESSSDNKSS